MKLILDKSQPKNFIYLEDIKYAEEEKRYILFYDSKWLLLETNEGYYQWFGYNDEFLLIEMEKNISSFKEAIDVVKYYFGFDYKPDAFEVFKKGDIDIRFKINK